MTALRSRAAAVRRGDNGSAVVEFVTLGMLLLLPLIYLVITLGRVQAATFAADGSAREAARAYVTATSSGDGEARAGAAVRLGTMDQGFDAEDSSLVVECTHDPCLTPEGRITTRVEIDVVLPGVPALVDRAIPAHITVRAAQVATVDAFRPVLTPDS